VSGIRIWKTLKLVAGTKHSHTAMEILLYVFLSNCRSRQFSFRRDRSVKTILKRFYDHVRNTDVHCVIHRCQYRGVSISFPEPALPFSVWHYKNWVAFWWCLWTSLMVKFVKPISPKRHDLISNTWDKIADIRGLFIHYFMAMMQLN